MNAIENMTTNTIDKATGDGKQIVLMIDDDKRHLTITKSFLEDDYEVVSSMSCEDALQLLSQGLSPSYILLDLIMPNVNGWNTYERIRAISNFHHIPIAIFTSSEDPANHDRANKMGAVDYIMKPCKKSELLERIKKNIVERGEKSIFDLDL